MNLRCSRTDAKVVDKKYLFRVDAKHDLQYWSKNNWGRREENTEGSNWTE